MMLYLLFMSGVIFGFFVAALLAAAKDVDDQ